MAIEAIKAGPARSRAGRFRGRPVFPAGSASESGQVSVSLVAVVPLLLLLGMGGLQAALAGHASIAASHAARAAARAEYVGEDSERAAARALPESMRRDAVVSVEDGVTQVKLSAPRALPFGPRITIRSQARVGPVEGLDG